MTPVIIYLLIGIAIGAGVITAILIPKVKVSQKINESIIETNKRNKELLDKYNIDLSSVQTLIKTEQSNFDSMSQSCESMKKLLQSQKDTAVETIQSFKQARIDEMKNELEKEKDLYDQAKDNYQNEYLKTMSDLVNSYRTKITASESEYWRLVDMLDDMQKKVESAVEAAKRAVEMENQIDFYRLVLSPTDIEEIECLRAVLPHLRNSEPLNKVIWKVYYEKPYTDLIGRVVGSGTHCGIYKITNLKNQMCYVGQAVNIADRWKQHIKRGLGAETPTRNKLYPAMLANGVENFSFEIIEECNRDKLNEREDYWQDYFKAKEFGYSIK